MSEVTSTAPAAADPDDRSRPAILTLNAGQLYLRTGTLQASTVELEVAKSILGQVMGPGGAPCVALAGDPTSIHRLAAMLASLAAQLPSTHPHQPWGALVTKAASEAGVASVREQITAMDGDVVVCYDGAGGDAQGADLVREACHEVGAGFVLVETPASWASMVRAGLNDFFPFGSVVVRIPEPSPAEVLRCLTDHAQQLAAFHGLAVPPDVVSQVAAASDRHLPGGLEMMPGQTFDPVTMGMARLNQWATHALVDPQEPVPVRVSRLSDALRAVVVGQDEAVAALAGHVALGLAGLRLRTDRPRTALMLTGSTGTGKTLLASTLAQVLEVPLIRVDLAAFTDRHRISTLLGSPPGYVGSDRDQNWLTTKIAAAPKAVLLLDEFDKSSPELWGPLLMEMLGAGTLTDEMGRSVSCRDLHVLVTANVGARDMTRGPTGFGDPDVRGRSTAALAAVRALLPEEVFNRLDDVLVLQPVNGSAGAQILAVALEALTARLAALGYTVRLSKGAGSVLLAHGMHDSDGARRMHRTLERMVVAPLLNRPPGAYQVVASTAGVRVQPQRRPSGTTHQNPAHG